jgi:hypothetical protein
LGVVLRVDCDDLFTDFLKKVLEAFIIFI